MQRRLVAQICPRWNRVAAWLRDAGDSQRRLDRLAVGAIGHSTVDAEMTCRNLELVVTVRARELPMS